VAAFSSFHFHRVFRGLVGETLKEYVDARLERAARNLKQLDGPLLKLHCKQIETHESFTRLLETCLEYPFRIPNRAQACAESASGTHLDDVSRYHPPDYPDLPLVEVKEFRPCGWFSSPCGPYTQVGATWGRLMAWAGMRGLLGPSMKLIGIVPTTGRDPAGQVRYDAACGEPSRTAGGRIRRDGNRRRQLRGGHPQRALR